MIYTTLLSVTFLRGNENMMTVTDENDASTSNTEKTDNTNFKVAITAKSCIVSYEGEVSSQGELDGQGLIQMTNGNCYQGHLNV